MSRELDPSIFPPSRLEGAAIFTVDVEDYFMSPECIPFEDWPKYVSCLHAGMERCLNLLQAYRARATFFFVGWAAERYPDLVRWTVEQGHEVATHTYTHRFVSEMNEREFEESLVRSLEVLRGLTGGQEVIGHRAPAFSLDRRTPWMFEILHRHGIRYDSSIMPHRTYLYGDDQAPRFPYRLHGVVEIPPGVVAWAGKRWPLGGGGTLRILPNWYLRWARNRFRREGYTPVVYVHPWEYVPEQPRLALPWKLRWIHYAGLGSMVRKTRAILEEGPVITMREYYETLRGEADH